MLQGQPFIIRCLYLLAAALFTAFTLSTYAAWLQQYLSIRYSFWLELGMVFGQVFFQGLWLWKKPVPVKIAYAFHLLTVSLIGSLLLWLYLLAAKPYPLPVYAALIYFFGVVAFMFTEHRRRVALLQLPAWLSYTWILYRLLILMFIL